jgi:cell division protein FtsB
MFHDLDAIFVFRMRSELHQTQNQIEYFTQRNGEIRAELSELTGNKQALEKFAREHYFMKRDNEDLYVFFASEE